MQRITLKFNEKNFEYDVYTLVKAFFPDADVTMIYTDEESACPEAELQMSVTESADSYLFLLEEKDIRTIEKEVSVPSGADRHERKNALKTLVYKTLCEYTGRELPWGDLTGIRPVRIPLDLIEKGWKNADIAAHMRETYFTSPKKTALAVAIANREKDILDRLDVRNGYSLYIGIPFCPSICLYCSFGSHPIEKYRDAVAPYMQALYKELAYLAEVCKKKKLTSIYIGGGTPTSLDTDMFSELLTFVVDHFSFEHLEEFTVEAGRPDTITEEKLYAMLASAVSRISINPQTMNQKTLDLIGRQHTVEQTVQAFELARNLGFDNINMDLIAGLPGEGPEEVGETLRQIEALRPDSLTIHSLALKRSSRLNLMKEEYAAQSFHNSEEIMERVGRLASRMGLYPYYLYRQKNMAGNLENVGYARDGCFGIYNILIMEEKQTILAAGSGAMTKLVYEDGRIERTPNVKDVGNYIERIDEMIERKRAVLE